MVVLCLVACGGSEGDNGYHPRADADPVVDVTVDTMQLCRDRAEGLCPQCDDYYCDFGPGVVCMGEGLCTSGAYSDCMDQVERLGVTSETFVAKSDMVNACAAELGGSPTCSAASLPQACRDLVLSAVE